MLFFKQSKEIAAVEQVSLIADPNVIEIEIYLCINCALLASDETFFLISRKKINYKIKKMYH